MSRTIIFRRLAGREFDDAVDWYNDRQPGRGGRFAAAVSRVLRQIADQPELYAEVEDGVREAPVPRYPYCVYYRTEPDHIIVTAVFHTSRDPADREGRA